MIKKHLIQKKLRKKISNRKRTDETKRKTNLKTTNLNPAIPTITLNVSGLNSKWKGKVYVNKFINSDEMDKFLERHKLPELNQEQTDNLHNPAAIN